MFRELRKTTTYLHPTEHESNQPLLRAVNLGLRYETGVALSGVTFDLQHGERLAVVGPNGAGKSTLFKIIAAVVEPNEGAIQIGGHEPAGHTCVAYVPQRSQVDWSFPATVFDAVMMGRSGKLGPLRFPRKIDREAVRAALERVKLVDLANRQIGQLSGGQQQRVFIARALAQEAELVLMDEPFTGLDAPSQADIFNILDVLRSLGVTVMVALHDLDLAARHFDRVMLLNRRLVGIGPATEIFTTERLLEAYGGRLRMLPGTDRFAVDDGCCGEHDHDHGHDHA